MKGTGHICSILEESKMNDSAPNLSILNNSISLSCTRTHILTQPDLYKFFIACTMQLDSGLGEKSTKC